MAVGDDTEAPVITACPADQSFDPQTDQVTATATWTEPTASDNTGFVTLTSTQNPGDMFPIGATLVTYTATDASGNKAICLFTVTVTGNLFIYIILFKHVKLVSDT